MTDIVEQLRTHDDARLYAEADLLMAEAADEIERNLEDIAELVDALQGVMKYVNTARATVDPGFYQIAIDEARALITKHTTTKGNQ